MITAGALPFDEPNLGLLFKKIQKADYQTPAWFSRDLAHLLRAIITPDPKARSALLALCMRNPFSYVPCPQASACCVRSIQLALVCHACPSGAALPRACGGPCDIALVPSEGCVGMGRH